MGVIGLWEILSPAGEVGVPLTTLRGQTIAVDLSAWIMEFTGVSAAPDKQYMMNRSLFYRTTCLLGMGVNLVFVLDGRAPGIKKAALLDRQEARCGSTSSVNLDRPGLNIANSQCVELLRCLGVPCIQSPGEAEAMCAYLNKEGLVDGCFTEDGDFFLYGGKTLYTNIQKNGKISSDEEVINVDNNDEDDDEVIVRKSQLKKKGKKKPKLFDLDEDEDPIPKEKKRRKSRKIVHVGGVRWLRRRRCSGADT